MMNHGRLGVCLHIPKEKPLRDCVQSFWQVTRQNQFRKEIIVPKGIVEIIFNFSTETKFRARLYDAAFIIPRCFVQGYHTGPIRLALPAHQALYGVVLHTAAAKQILGVPPGELVRQCIDLTMIDPSFDFLWHQLSEKKSFQERTMLLSHWILKRMNGLSDRERYFNRLFTLSISGNFTVPDISELLCYSSRHLSRKFYELSGLNTEQTLLYLKYLKAKRLIHHSDLTLTQIAFACEFSDQSHFIKTFRSFTDLSPREYRIKKSRIPGHYFE